MGDICDECQMVKREIGTERVCPDCGDVSLSPSESVAPAGGKEIPEDYRRWNEVIADVVYPTGTPERPVYLNVDEVVLEQCGRNLGIDGGAAGAQRSLTSVVADTLGEESKLLSACARWVRDWEAGSRSSPPPVLPTLAVFSLAAELMANDEDIVSWNYYGRLWRLVGMEDRTGEQHYRMQQGYRRAALSMWEALNTWLRELGGSRGSPTATPRGNRRFVSVPIGQALVRQAERDRLPAFFGWAGLRPEQEVAPDRMELLLGRWVTSSSAPLGSRIRRVWGQNADLRAAFADTAVAELEGWDGITRRRGGQSGTLALAAVRSRRRGFGLRVAVVGSESEPPSVLQVGDLAHTPQWREIGGGLWVDMVEPPTDVLAHTIKAGSLQRQHRQVTVFRHEAGTYLETPAVELGERFIIVAKHGLGVVDEAVRAFSRPGWSVERVGTWAVFTDVEIGQTVQHELLPPELQPLTTLSGQALGLVGGIKLPGGPAIWSAAAPPRVVVADPPQGTFTLSLESEHDQPIRHDLGSNSGVVELALNRWDLTPGVWRVRLVGAAKHNATFTLLSSDEPSTRWVVSPRLWVGREPRTGRTFSSESGPASAIVGAADNQPAAMVPGVLSWATGGEAAATSQNTRLEIANATKLGGMVRQSHVPCFEGGWHRTDLDANPGRKECDYCRVVPGSARRATEQFREAMAARSGRIGDLGEEHLDALALLEGHIHLRGGESRRHYDWLARLGLDGLTQATWRKDLMALGHADFDPATGRWSMLSPALLGHATIDGAWLLVGLTTASELQQLREAVADLGGTWANVPSGAELRGPRTVIRGLATEDARLVASDVATLEVHPQAGLELARRLPVLPDLGITGTPRAYGADTRARRYDPTVALWSETSREIDEPGAYRVGPGYRDEFWWVDEDGSARLVPDGETAKFLAGWQEKIPHAAYVDGTLVTPLGARLPPLYERAIVASTFRLPEDHAGQTSYLSTPQPIAAIVFGALHPDAIHEVHQ